MTKIVKVTSNIKSPDGSAWTHEIGKHNLLVGPNESGKSAIAEAIQLAVSGSAYGLFLRNAPVKTGTQLIELGPVGGGDVFAEVEFEDGTVSRWEMAPGKKPKQTGKTAVALPITELRAALGGSAQKARAFFATHLLPPMKRVELERLLRHPEHDLSVPLEVVLPDLGHAITGEVMALLPSKTSSAKRKVQAEQKAASALLKTFTLAEKADNSHIYDVWERLFQALRFEWAKKQFKKAEDPVEKVFLKKLALSLGEPEELKNLDGSAQYSEELEALLSQNALYGASCRARSTILQAEQTANEYAALEATLDTAIMSLLKTPLKEFTKRVNKFLPRGDKFDIIHTEKAFKPCLRRGGQTHTALSGSAEARTLAAVGSALVKKGESAILILDDRMWDTSTLSSTMEKLESSQCQIILMTTISPRGRKRSAWTYVEVSRSVCEEKVEAEASASATIEKPGDPLPW